MPKISKNTLVDVSHYGFVVEPRYYYFGWSKSPQILARKSLVDMLKLAKAKLPAGYNFKIYDGYRTYETQKKISESFWKRLKLMHPRLGDEMLFLLLVKFSGGVLKNVPKPDSHRNGGALDLTIIDQHGASLYMGTEIDDLTEKAALDYFKNKRKKFFSMERLAGRNRLMLEQVMTEAGFKGYKYEWWHWSSSNQQLKKSNIKLNNQDIKNGPDLLDFYSAIIQNNKELQVIN